ncbi:hypothetical protein F4604DRAFT_1685562 [Suillus subluteus]|nr:hypothetical protein F4604DRAFT_1685562 [Suillus subluteus]
MMTPSFRVQMVLGAVSVVGTLPALYFSKTWGRRKFLLLVAAGQAVCALIVALVGHTTLAPTGTPTSALTARNRAGGYVIITFAVFRVFIFGTTWGPTPWVYLGESLPLRVRPKSIALSSATNWFWNFMLSFFSPRIVDRGSDTLLGVDKHLLKQQPSVPNIFSMTDRHVRMNATRDLSNLPWTVATLNPMTIEVLQIFWGGTTIIRKLIRVDKIAWNHLRMKLGDVVNIRRCLGVPYGKGIYVLPFDNFIKGLSGNIFNVYPRPHFLEGTLCQLGLAGRVSGMSARGLT